jgi:hypothetical protein
MERPFSTTSSGTIPKSDFTPASANEGRAMKPFTTIADILFACVALLQLVRFIEAWPVSINGFAVPVWASAFAFVVATILSAMLWRENRK